MSKASVCGRGARDCSAAGAERIVRDRVPVADCGFRSRRSIPGTEGYGIYAKRKRMIELIFGQIKHVRGFQQFLLRGLAKMRGEWSLIGMSHNLLKLFQARERAIA